LKKHTLFQAITHGQGKISSKKAHSRAILKILTVIMIRKKNRLLLMAVKNRCFNTYHLNILPIFASQCSKNEYFIILKILLRMKKLILLPLFALFFVALQAQNSYNVNTSSSVVVWTGYKVTGKHTGTVKIKSGSLQFKDGLLSGGTFEMDMNTINCTDLEGEYAGKLIGHLKSDDFLAVASNPTATMVITRAIAQDSKGNYKIVGNLTIKGTTKEVKFFANVQDMSGAVNATGKITIDRSEYDMRYGSGSFFDGLGDKTIYDEFDLQISLVAGK